VRSASRSVKLENRISPRSGVDRTTLDKYIIATIKVTDMKYLLFMVLLVAILITAGCVSKNKETVVTSTPTPLPKDVQVPNPIIGFWRKSLSTGYYTIYQFNADGTFDYFLRENLDTWDTRQGHGMWNAQGNNSYTLYDATLGENETFIYDPIQNGIRGTKYPHFLLYRIQGDEAIQKPPPRLFRSVGL
jgi:hypothetical protein